MFKHIKCSNCGNPYTNLSIAELVVESYRKSDDQCEEDTVTDFVQEYWDIPANLPFGFGVYKIYDNIYTVQENDYFVGLVILVPKLSDNPKRV